MTWTAVVAIAGLLLTFSHSHSLKNGFTPVSSVRADILLHFAHSSTDGAYTQAQTGHCHPWGMRPTHRRHRQFIPSRPSSHAWSLHRVCGLGAPSPRSHRAQEEKLTPAISERARILRPRAFLAWRISWIKWGSSIGIDGRMGLLTQRGQPSRPNSNFSRKSHRITE